MSPEKACLFLDRDGVIIENVPYGKDPAQVRLKDGIVALLQQARKMDFWIVVVTNQSGIGRGWNTLQDYQNITAQMQKLLKSAGVQDFDRIYFSPYFEQATDPQWLKNPHWRKPETGMIDEACKDLRIDKKRSLIVGDRFSDIECGHRASLGRKILLVSSEFPDEIQKMPIGIEFEIATHPNEIKL